jgi:hypothetical protein
MITLTTSSKINSVLGGNSLVDYDRLVISPLTFDPQALTITGQIKLTSIANPDMQTVIGSLVVNTSQGKLQVEVPQLNFLRRITLSGPQITTINTLITNAQNSVENGLINLGVISGTQSTGS